MNKMWNQLTKSLTIGKIVGLGVFATVFFYAGYGVGAAQSAASEQEIPGRVVNVRGGRTSSDLDFEQFWDVWNTVKSTYVEDGVSERDLFYGAISGIVEGLNDPYSVYFDPEDAEAFKRDLEGSFFGIGAELDEKEGAIVVVTPLKGTPAEKAGVRAGDYILKVNGESTEGWTVQEAVRNIRGEEGTKVTLSLFTEGEDDVREVTITRGKIVVDSVTWKKEGDIGVIQITQFNQDTTRLFDQAVNELNASALKGIVLDLRGNPGGLLDEAVGVADFWIDDKIVLVEKTRDDEMSFRAGKGAPLGNIPTVVLVNGGSASAAEILAGALQDYGVRVIGEQTFGKGSVQDYQELQDGSALKVTVAKWFTPKGRSIDDVGIAPDEVVALTREDYDAKTDPQFEAARLYLTNAR